MQSHNEMAEVDLATLKEELDVLEHEVRVIKNALKRAIARYEIGQIKKGENVKSILDH